MSACPDCTANNSKPVTWGDDISSLVLRDYYPDARECLSCGSSWSPKQIADRKAVSELLVALVRRAQ